MIGSPMALDVSEWIMAIVIVGAFLAFGPDKIPQIAKQIGRAKAEFDKASAEAKTLVDSAVKSIEQESTNASAAFDGSAADLKRGLNATASEIRSSFDLGSPPSSALPPAPTTTPPSAEEGSGNAVSVAGSRIDSKPPDLQTGDVNEDALLALAHRMQIKTEGKTKDEISEEIFSKARVPQDAAP